MKQIVWRKPVTLLVVIQFTKKASETLSGHLCISPLHASTIAFHIMKCPCSIILLALELYDEIVTYGIPMHSNSNQKAFWTLGPLLVTTDPTVP